MTTANNAIETRSIEDSFSHAHDAAGRAEHLVNLIADDLNGNGPGAIGMTQPGPPMGLVSSADRLASRMEGLCRELEGIRARLVSNKPQSLAAGTDYVQGQAIGIGRAGYLS